MGTEWGEGAAGVGHHPSGLSWLGHCGQLILNPVAKKKRREKQTNKNEDVENRHVHPEWKWGMGRIGRAPLKYIHCQA